MFGQATPASDSWLRWREAARASEVDAAISRLYAEIDADVAARGPTCWQSGKCCHFREFGHRLYVTALEVAWFLDRADPPPAPEGLALPQLGRTRDGDGDCPWQVDEACTAHGIRPLGCRVFFCQHGTEAWQQALYEKHQARLKALHVERGIAYRYLEWVAGLNEAQEALGLATEAKDARV